MAKLRIPDALEEVRRDRWKCETCTAPAEEESTFCLHCGMYWEDVRNGMFDEIERSVSIQEAD